MYLIYGLFVVWLCFVRRYREVTFHVCHTWAARRLHRSHSTYVCMSN